MLRRGILALCLASAAFTAGSALAQKSAAALVHRGDLELRRGHPAKALEAYQAAQQASHDPALLLQIGLAYERLGDHEKAIVAYRSYLRRVPGGSGRPLAERRLARLERALRAPQRLGAVSLTPAPLAAAPLTAAPLTPPPLALVPLEPAPSSAEPRPSWPPVAAAEPPSPVASAAATAGHGGRTLLFALGGAALALAIPAAYSGGWGIDALSISSHNEALASQSAQRVYLPEQRSYTIQAVSWLSVAAILAAGGVYLLATAPGSGG